MTYDPERDETPSYEGEVTEVQEGMRLRTKVAIGALGAGVVLAATGNWWPLIVLICLYFVWMCLREVLRRRKQEKDWNAVANNVMEGGN
jgi:hypothetical protein